MNFYYNSYYPNFTGKRSKKALLMHGLRSLAALIRFLEVDYNYSQPLPSKLIKLVTFEKGETIISIGQKEGPVYYILEGGIKLWNGNEERPKILCLLNEGNFITSLNTLASHTGSDVNFTATSNLTCLAIDESVLDDDPEVRERMKKGKAEFINKSIFYAFGFQKLHSSILLLPNEEKLGLIYLHFPDMFDTFNLSDIAVLFGMRPESFSRLKKKVIDKKDS